MIAYLKFFEENFHTAEVARPILRPEAKWEGAVPMPCLLVVVQQQQQWWQWQLLGRSSENLLEASAASPGFPGDGGHGTHGDTALWDSAT